MAEVVEKLRPDVAGVDSRPPVIATPQGLAHAGRMDATPIAGDSTQALEAWNDDVSGIESAGCVKNRGASGGWKCP